MQNSLKTKKMAVIIAAAVIAFGTGVFVYSMTATAQVTSLGQIGNSFEPIYPSATPFEGKLTDVNGVRLTTIASSDQSDTVDRQGGVPKSKIEAGRATLELKHGVSQNGNDVIAATITNSGKDTIYLINLRMFGQTPEKMEPLIAYVVDASYSPEVFGKIPKPAIVEPVELAPGQSYSGYVVGKWNISNQPINSFSAGATYVYDINAKVFVQDNNWSISTTSTKLP